ncbi:hypothetical protein Hdeb2414_s0017g00510441 [Helianthus debilis subsp. tardiflorus]
MMLGRTSRKARLVVREKMVRLLPFGECFTRTSKARLRYWLVQMVRKGSTIPFVTISGCLNGTQWRQCCRDLGALGYPDATGVPKQHVQKHGDKRFRRPKKPHEPVVVPPLVPEVAGISRIRLCKYNDYVVVSDTLEGLGVPGGGAAAGGSSVGSELADDKKRKGDTATACGQKGPKLRRTRTAAIPQSKPAVTTETREKPRRRVKEVFRMKWLPLRLCMRRTPRRSPWCKLLMICWIRPTI